MMKEVKLWLVVSTFSSIVNVATVQLTSKNHSNYKGVPGLDLVKKCKNN